MNWHQFYREHQWLGEKYPGLTEQRFVREAQEISHLFNAETMIEKFRDGEPFVYILGYAEFGGLKFKVSRDTLIPRSETEQLTDRILTDIKAHPWKRALDVGTGSGCIGLTLKVRNPQLFVQLTDISQAALAIAKTNADDLKVSVTLTRSDLLNDVTGLFDVIVSNPPYIPRSLTSKVHPMTDQHEPHLALYVDDEEYEKFFRRLFHQAAKHLASGGRFYMEGHEDRLDRCRVWAQEAGLSNPRIEQDWYQRPRFLIAEAAVKPII